ncbi:MAG: LysM peptidoglycan-binding domain-containing protein [Lachnospira sp.]
MIEIICNSEDSEKQSLSGKMSIIRRPKNIKQIGDVSSDKKIYIEDYAFTYINSIAYNNPSEEQAGVLLGEFQKDDDEKCVFIKGVIKAKFGDEVLEKGVYFNENVWNGIYSDIEKYFPNLSVVGWFASVPQVTMERMLRLKKMHLDNFAGAMKTFYLIDTVEKEENFYLYENGELKKQKGYVCFYERNYEMQEYMLERREGRSNEDRDSDRAVRSIRTIIKEKEEAKEQKKTASFMYTLSGFMAVVVLVIGINLLNNYEKMKKFDHSINSIMSQMNSTENGNGKSAVTTGGDSLVVDRLPGEVYPTESETYGTENGSATEYYTNASAQAGSTDAQEETRGEVESVNATVQQTTVSTEVSAQPAYLYTIKAGDTLYGICKSYYGDASKAYEVIKYNNLENEDKLIVGQQIKLP